VCFVSVALSVDCYDSDVSVEVNRVRRSVDVTLPPMTTTEAECGALGSTVVVVLQSQGLTLSERFDDFDPTERRTFSLPCPADGVQECLDKLSFSPSAAIHLRSSTPGQASAVDVSTRASRTGIWNYAFSDCYADTKVLFQLGTSKGLSVHVAPKSCCFPEEALGNFHAYITIRESLGEQAVTLEVPPNRVIRGFTRPYSHETTVSYDVSCDWSSGDAKEQCEEAVRAAMRLDSLVTLELTSSFAIVGTGSTIEPPGSRESPDTPDKPELPTDPDSSESVSMEMSISVPVTARESITYKDTFAPASVSIFRSYIRLDYSIAEGKEFAAPAEVALTIFSLLVSDNSDPELATHTLIFTSETDVEPPSSRVRFGCTSEDRECATTYEYFKSLGENIHVLGFVAFQDANDEVVDYAILEVAKVIPTPWEKTVAVVGTDKVCFWATPQATADRAQEIFVPQVTNVTVQVLINEGESELDIITAEYATLQKDTEFFAGKRVCLYCDDLIPKKYANGGQDCSTQLREFKQIHRKLGTGQVHFYLYGVAYPCTTIGFDDTTALYIGTAVMLIVLGIAALIYSIVRILRMRQASRCVYSDEPLSETADLAPEEVL